MGLIQIRYTLSLGRSHIYIYIYDYIRVVKKTNKQEQTRYTPTDREQLNSFYSFIL